MVDRDLDRDLHSVATETCQMKHKQQYIQNLFARHHQTCKCRSACIQHHWTWISICIVTLLQLCGSTLSTLGNAEAHLHVSHHQKATAKLRQHFFCEDAAPLSMPDAQYVVAEGVGLYVYK